MLLNGGTDISNTPISILIVDAVPALTTSVNVSPLSQRMAAAATLEKSPDYKDVTSMG